MVIYQGSATLVDGERTERVTVMLRTSEASVADTLGSATAATSADTEPRWNGRMLSNCDWGHWCGQLVSIDLPSGARAQVVLERSGVLTGFGRPPFGR